MILIHTALLCEAMPLIEYFKLTKKQKNIYQNSSIVLIVSGIGLKNTKNALLPSVSKFDFKKAFNVGIAGCKNENIPIGSLFCTNDTLPNIANASITSVRAFTKEIKTTLVDMESEAFVDICKSKKIPHFVMKIVSDHLDKRIPQKSFVSDLVRKSLDKWVHLI